MNENSLSILPDFARQSAALINLDDQASAYLAVNPATKSPFLAPDFLHDFLEVFHRHAGVAYSWGGYLEDRRNLWKGSYLDDHAAVHLGIDVNVPAGSRISVAYACHVERIVHDPDQNGGWGSVIMFALDQPVGQISHFLYAHFGRNGIQVQEGQNLKAGDIAGILGKPHENGGWYEHLHVQAMTAQAWNRLRGDLAKFDGYGSSKNAHPDFPDPAPILR